MPHFSSALKLTGMAGAFLLAGCASVPSFVANLDDAPAWFVDQLGSADNMGYPQAAQTPPVPEDIPPLSYFDNQVAEISAMGTEVKASPRASSADVPTEAQVRQFADEAHDRADVQKFNDEEEALLQQEQAKKKKR